MRLRRISIAVTGRWCRAAVGAPAKLACRCIADFNRDHLRFLPPTFRGEALGAALRGVILILASIPLC